MKLNRRILPLLLALSLALPMLPLDFAPLFFKAHALEEMDGDVYLVRGPDDLKEVLSSTASGSYRQMVNIEINLSDLPRTPKTFTGTYDGNGYTVTVTGMPDGEYTSYGLFQNVNGTIQNLNVRYSGITVRNTLPYGKVQFGGVAGTLLQSSSKIENCSVEGSMNIQLAGNYFVEDQKLNYAALWVSEIGGIAGRVEQGASITGCRSAINITVTALKPNTENFEQTGFSVDSNGHYYYDTFIGGIAGGIHPGTGRVTLNNNLVEGNAGGTGYLRSSSPQSTQAYTVMGGVVGWVGNSNTNYEIKGNLIRNMRLQAHNWTGISSTKGYGVAYALAGWLWSAGTGDISNNIITENPATITSASHKSGAYFSTFENLFFSYDPDKTSHTDGETGNRDDAQPEALGLRRAHQSYSIIQGLVRGEDAWKPAAAANAQVMVNANPTPAFLRDSNSDPVNWVNDIIGNNGATQPVNLKWRTTPAPLVEESIDDELKYTINITSSPKQPPIIGDTQFSANLIDYFVEYYTEGANRGIEPIINISNPAVGSGGLEAALTLNPNFDIPLWYSLDNKPYEPCPTVIPIDFAPEYDPDGKITGAFEKVVKVADNAAGTGQVDLTFTPELNNGAWTFQYEYGDKDSVGTYGGKQATVTAKLPSYSPDFQRLHEPFDKKLKIATSGVISINYDYGNGTTGSSTTNILEKPLFFSPVYGADNRGALSGVQYSEENKTTYIQISDGNGLVLSPKMAVRINAWLNDARNAIEYDIATDFANPDDAIGGGDPKNYFTASLVDAENDSFTPMVLRSPDALPTKSKLTLTCEEDDKVTFMAAVGNGEWGAVGGIDVTLTPKFNIDGTLEDIEFIPEAIMIKATKGGVGSDEAELTFDFKKASGQIDFSFDEAFSLGKGEKITLSPSIASQDVPDDLPSIIETVFTLGVDAGGKIEYTPEGGATQTYTQKFEHPLSFTPEYNTDGTVASVSPEQFELKLAVTMPNTPARTSTVTVTPIIENGKVTFKATPVVIPGEGIKRTITNGVTNPLPTPPSLHPVITATEENIEIKIQETIQPLSTVTVRVYQKDSASSFTNMPRVKTYNFQTEDATEPPEISPASGEPLADGITMTSPDGATIYYYMGDADLLPALDAESIYTEPIDYDTVMKIKDGDWTTLFVSAIAVKNGVPSSPVKVQYSVNSKTPPSAPEIWLAQPFDEAFIFEQFEPSVFYEPDQKFAIILSGGEDTANVHYTLNGSVPDSNSARYNSKNHIQLPTGQVEVTITAVHILPNFPPSETETITVNIKQELGAPLFSMENSQKIPNSDDLRFMLPETVLPQEITPDYYVRYEDALKLGTDQDERDIPPEKWYNYAHVQSNPDDYYGVLLVDDDPDFDYNDYTADLPLVTYKIEDGSERTYIPGRPAIIFNNTDGSTTSRQPRTDATVKLTGTAGQGVAVTAWLTPSNAAHKEGPKITRTFYFYEAVPSPVPTPPTSPGAMTTVSAGEMIYLGLPDSNMSGAQIFYSLQSAIEIKWDEANDRYATAGNLTFDYSENQADGVGIEVKGIPGRTFTIWAGAIMKDMSPSPVEQFTYRIADMDRVAPPTATPNTSPGNVAEISKDGHVVLVSTTSGAKISYSLTGSPTEPYSTVATKGIPVEGNPGSIFTVYAVAEMDNMAPSAVQTFTYRISDLPVVAAPVATPKTEDSNATVLPRGTRISLSSATNGAAIAYSTDGSYPTEEYDPITGIEIDGEPGRFYTVSAIAHKEPEMTESQLVTFVYRVADLPVVAAPVATPKTEDSNATVLPRGTRISLSSATSSAAITYSTDGSYPTEEYDPITGIEIDGEPGRFYTVSAIAHKEPEMTESQLVTFVYRVADLPVAAAPTATPKTEPGEPLTLQTGTAITLQTATSGGKIYYSLTGTPAIGAAGTSLFDKSINVTGSSGQFFTIRAFTAMDGMQNSEIVTFNYQLPAPVQAVYATPSEGDVIEGTEIELKTTTRDATIFYEIFDDEDDVEEPIPYESQVYGDAIKIEKDTWITAMAVKDGEESIITEFEFLLADEVEPPEPSIPSGSVVAKGAMLRLTSPTGGASIVYTKDGSDPTDEDNNKRMFGESIAIDAEEGKSVSLQAYATLTGRTPSEVVSLSYTVSEADEVITANPADGAVLKPGDRVTLSTTITGAALHYTTDGSEPTRDSPSGSAVTVDGAYGESFVIRAAAFTETTATAPQVFSYTVVARTASPAASIPNGAVVLAGATVTLTAPEGSIYYTVDGGDPATAGILYTEPIALTGSTVLKIMAQAEGKAQSETLEYIYTQAGQVAAPAASLPAGQIEVGVSITMSTTTPDAEIYYTTNGASPSADNLRDAFAYEGPITVSRPVTFRMIAVKQGMDPSVVNTATYTVAYPPEPEEEAPDAATPLRDSDRLFLFDQFVDSGEGPQFTDIILRDDVTLAVVSATTDAVPDDTRLIVVRERDPAPEDEDAVLRGLDMKLGALYNISLVDSSGMEVQPQENGGVEVGVPTPEGCEDTVVLICRINENGTVTAFPTRRSAGMLYAVVDHFSKYAVAVPELPQESDEQAAPWLLIATAVAIAAFSLMIIMYRKRRKGGQSK